MSKAVTYPMKQFRCPNGMRFWNAPESGRETAFIYKEIFENLCYEKHGVTIADGDVVFDVGANAGIFACSLISRFSSLRVYCFEPIPNTRACLERNINECSGHESHEVTVLNVALGSSTQQATMNFFPSAPGNSTLYPEQKKQEFEALAEGIGISDIWKINKGVALILLLLYPLKRWLIQRLFQGILGQAESVACKVCRLSDVIREQGVERIDLLKVDVEGAELEVLAGIDEQHWPLIRQLVLEVAPANRPQLSLLSDRLRSLGFSRIVIEDMLGSNDAISEFGPCNVYALRSE